MKQRPTHALMSHKPPSGDHLPDAMLVPVYDYPDFLALPQFGAPRLLGLPGESGTQWFFCKVTDWETLREPGSAPKPNWAYRELEIDYLGRLLAKIAFCMAIVAFGVDGFDKREMRSVIKGTHSDWLQLVGGTSPEMNQFPAQVGKIVLHKSVAYSQLVDKKLMGMIQMQLFSYVNAPIYTVVVGELNQAGVDKLNAG